MRPVGHQLAAFLQRIATPVSGFEPGLDWTDINVVTDKRAALRIEPPASLIEGIFLDQCFNAGNRVAEHHLDRPASLLHAG